MVRTVQKNRTELPAELLVTKNRAKNIFYNDISAYNAFVIWTEIFPECQNKRRIFLEEMGKALVVPHI